MVVDVVASTAVVVRVVSEVLVETGVTVDVAVTFRLVMLRQLQASEMAVLARPAT